MASLKGFLGQDFELPEDRAYDGARNLWLCAEVSEGNETTVILGVSQPGVVLTGGLLEIEVFPEPGDELIVDEEIAFATTRKNMKYFLSPVAGKVIEANREATAEALNENPYDYWLVRVVPAAGWDSKLLAADAYAAKLGQSEHATPEAVQAAQAAKMGKSSPTCKSIYSGMKEG